MSDEHPYATDDTISPRRTDVLRDNVQDRAGGFDRCNGAGAFVLMLRNRLREREQDNGVVLAFISVHARIASSSSMALTQSCRPRGRVDHGRS